MVPIFMLNISADIAIVSGFENARGHAMCALLIALTLMIGSQAGAECGKLCDRDWWKTATAADVQFKLDKDTNLKMVLAEVKKARTRRAFS